MRSRYEQAHGYKENLNCLHGRLPLTFRKTHHCTRVVSIWFFASFQAVFIVVSTAWRIPSSDRIRTSCPSRITLPSRSNFQSLVILPFSNRLRCVIIIPSSPSTLVCSEPSSFIVKLVVLPSKVCETSRVSPDLVMCSVSKFSGGGGGDESPFGPEAGVRVTTCLV